MLTTITISKRTKDILARLKGDKTWGSFLLELAEEYRRRRADEALKRLRK